MSDATTPSTADTVNRALAVAAASFHALEAIGTATRGLIKVVSPDGPMPTVVSDNVMTFLTSIVAVVDSVQASLVSPSPDDRAAIESAKADLLTSIASADAAMQAAIDAKFPPPKG